VLVRSLPLCAGPDCVGENRGDLPGVGGGGGRGSGVNGEKGTVQMGGREVGAGGEEGFQMYFSSVLGVESEVRAIFGEELGAYKLVQKEL